MDKVLNSENEKNVIDPELRAKQTQVIKQMMFHRTKVALKMSTIANELVMRGRRHDNSYSSETELAIATKLLDKNLSEEEVSYNKELLDQIHGTFNDYDPRYFEQGFHEMNLIQLIEYIADKMARYEEEHLKDGKDEYISKIPSEEYHEYVLSGLGKIPTILAEFIENTIDFLIDHIGYTKALLNKKGMVLEEYVKDKEK